MEDKDLKTTSGGETDSLGTSMFNWMNPFGTSPFNPINTGPTLGPVGFCPVASDPKIEKLKTKYKDHSLILDFIKAYESGSNAGLRTAIQEKQTEAQALGDTFFQFLNDVDYWAYFREEIVRISNEEYDNWEDDDGGRIKEKEDKGDDAGYERVKDYWEDGTDTKWIDTKAEIGEYAWSATFISWVLNQAGHFGAFTPSTAHTHFFEDGIENRQDNTSNPFKVYDVKEIKPMVGDMAIKNRSGGSMTTNTLNGGNKSHSDIITEIDTEAKTVTLIGGNVGDSVEKSTATLDDDGFMTGGKYFSIMRIGGPGPKDNGSTESLFKIEVVSTVLNVRETPYVLKNNNTDADEANLNKVGQLKKGDQKDVYEEKDGWYRIGSNEWVSAGSKYVKKIEAPTASGAPSNVR